MVEVVRALAASYTSSSSGGELVSGAGGEQRETRGVGKPPGLSRSHLTRVLKVNIC